MGKESFARAQGKYLYQCEEKASCCWCQPAGIFIVYKLLLLELNSGKRGTKEGTVSQHESLNSDKAAWPDMNAMMQSVSHFFLPGFSCQETTSCFNPTSTTFIRITRKTRCCVVLFGSRIYGFFFHIRMIKKMGENLNGLFWFIFFFYRTLPCVLYIVMIENK